MSQESSDSRLDEFMQAIFTDSGTPIRLIWQMVQGVLVFASCFSMLLENYEPYRDGFAGFISVLDLTALAFLTLDFLGNLYVSSEKIKYIFSFWGLVDLLAILPFYLMMLNPTSGLMVKCLRALRFVRLFVLWRIARGRF